MAQMVKNLPAMWETWVRSPGGEDPLEKRMTTHSSILAWRIPWTEEPGGLQSVGSHRMDTTAAAAKSLQSCLTLCDPMDCSLPGSSVHRILQARILEWVAIPFFRGSSQPWDKTQVSGIAGRFFTIWPPVKPIISLLVSSYIIYLF